MDRVRYLILDNYVHPPHFLRNHTSVDTLITYINLKEGLALLGLVPRYMQCSHKKKKKKEESRALGALLNCSHWGWDREHSNPSV